MRMKFLARIECNQIRFIKIKKSGALVTIQGRLYRADDRYYVKDYLSGDAMRFQRIDSTQIIDNAGTYIDPDMTRIISDSAKLSGNKKKIWLNLDSSKLWQYLTIIAVVGSLIYGFLVMG